MTLLAELLEAPDFGRAVSGLAREFLDKHELPPVHQLGLVVPDVEAAAIELEKLGIGPFFIAAGKPVLWQERGEKRTFAGKLGMAYHKGFELELLEPGQGSDFYGRSIDPEGIVVQHVGLIVEDVDQWAVKLVSRGNPIYVRGRIKTGPMNTDFAYMDTEKEAGIVVEFISWKLFGKKVSPSPGLFHLLGRIEKFTGKRSISV